MFFMALYVYLSVTLQYEYNYKKPRWVLYDSIKESFVILGEFLQGSCIKKSYVSVTLQKSVD